MLLPYCQQKTFVVEARFSVSPDAAFQFVRELNGLTRKGEVSYSVRNQCRPELKARGIHVPRRLR